MFAGEAAGALEHGVRAARHRARAGGGAGAGAARAARHLQEAGAACDVRRRRAIALRLGRLANRSDVYSRTLAVLDFSTVKLKPNAYFTI